MQEFVNAILKEEADFLMVRNIHKGCNCSIISRMPYGKWLTVFYNDKNSGDFAVLPIEDKYLTATSPMPSFMISVMKEAMEKPNFFEHTELRKMKLEEHDEVELIVENKKYARRGAHKGMTGFVVSERAINGEWCVLFPQPLGVPDFDTGIDEKDLKLLSRTKL